MRDAAWGERGCFEGRGGKRGGERRTGRLVSQAMRAASMDPPEERCTQLYQCIQGHTKGRGEQGFAKLQLSVLNLCVCVAAFFLSAPQSVQAVFCPCFCKTVSVRGEPLWEKKLCVFSLDFAFYCLVFCLIRENKRGTNQRPKTQLNIICPLQNCMSPTTTAEKSNHGVDM
jgi:hypothetical protein